MRTWNTHGQRKSSNSCFATHSQKDGRFGNLCHKTTGLELQTNRTVTIAFPECEEKNHLMHCGHSKLLNCVLMTKMTWTRYVGQNLFSCFYHFFQSAKFYPQPSHANKIVGICLYKQISLPGFQGDVTRMQYGMIKSEVIILRQTQFDW